MSATLVQIPVIDFQSFVQGEDLAAQQAVSNQIYQACHNVGFLYLKNHGISQTLLDRMFAQSQWFFNLPIEAKRQLAWSNEFSNRGYIGIERERLDPDKPGDLKEAFNVGREGNPASLTAGDQAALVANQFPPHHPAFRQTVLEFYDACCAAVDRILYAFAMSLQLPQDFFVLNHNQRCNTLRLLHYPPVTHPPQPDQIRAGEHSDYGSITLLFQDDVGGLEVKTADGNWMKAPCIPGTVIINTGDLMQRWTNHVFCSTKHRVGVPTDERLGRSRYSIAFFCHPNDETEIACLPSCQGANQPPRYAPISAGDYLLSKLQATY